MIYYESNSTDPYFNLALEEYFFEKMDRTESYFLLWQNANTIVVGKYQNTAEEINRQYVEEHGIRVARRLSGGGAVYHDMGNLNFTFIVDQNKIEEFNFRAFVLPLIETLKTIGVKAEFNGRNDVTIDGAKFSGNSQYSKKGRLMHHGCIMLDSDLGVVSEALRVKDVKFSSKAVKSVRSRVTTINANAPEPIDMETFKALLRDQIFSTSHPTTAILTPEQIKEIRALRDEKYATWEWNFGASPAYDMRKEMKFPAGLVTVLMKVSEGKIEDIHFYGDFFGNGDIHDLERQLCGMWLDDSLAEHLNRIDTDTYMKGIRPSDLYSLLMH